jgi:hypothetical protein
MSRQSPDGLRQQQAFEYLIHAQFDVLGRGIGPARQGGLAPFSVASDRTLRFDSAISASLKRWAILYRPCGGSVFRETSQDVYSRGFGNFDRQVRDAVLHTVQDGSVPRGL